MFGLRETPSFYFATALKESYMGCSDKLPPPDPYKLGILYTRTLAYGSGCLQIDSTSAWVEMEVLELVDARYAQQTVARPQIVIEEPEWPALGQGDEPQRELGEDHRERILVHAVQAPLGNNAACIDEPLIRFLWNQQFARRAGRGVPIRRDARDAGVPLLGIFPRFDQPLRQIPARLH